MNSQQYQMELSVRPDAVEWTWWVVCEECLLRCYSEVLLESFHELTANGTDLTRTFGGCSLLDGTWSSAGKRVLTSIRFPRLPE